jgi:hypothetical protein
MTHFAHLHHAPLVRQNSSATVSVLVADDHPAVLHGLADILRSTPDIKVVALCNDGTAAIEAVRRFHPLIFLPLGDNGAARERRACLLKIVR